MLLKAFAIGILSAGLSLFAQTPPSGCSQGQSIITTLANVGAACTPVTLPLGSYIALLNQGGAISSQTICDTTSTCPAGFFSLHIYVNPVNLGVLGAVSAFVTYTDDVGAKSNVALGTALSLLTSAPGQYTYNLYHAANTAITVNTTVGTLTGSPTYNFRARLVWLGS